ncbi:uroporphyrinogen-III synthase [Luteimonas suaedae]|uniref:uroporphyrinogen-III synthase n=1 Tax=Luteimonas suaedae TaxID=2605430 RepID=UPI0011EC6A96|nr:uroporphyrinogen-III synthase [Luteimonas suaedae]
MAGTTASAALQGCYVISLRPVGSHAGLRQAAARHGARVLALSPWRLVARDDADSARALRRALSASRVIFTSPAAVRAAHALLPLRPRRAQLWLGVGAGTRDALRRAGIDGAIAPARMDSEGVLALPALREVRGTDVGLITAPGGRGHIAAELRRRGARVLRADVYARVAVAPSPRALARLRATTAPLLLALSSGEALQRSLAALPADVTARLRRARVLAASARLATLARRHGFADITVAADARPRSLLAAAQERGIEPAIR